MIQVPKRHSLVAQTTDILRQGLMTGEWRDSLPGGRTLCARLQVSRFTLRLALQVLQRERLIQIAHGRRIRIIGRVPSPRCPVQTRIVGMLHTEPIDAMRCVPLYFITRLQHHLQVAGFELQLHYDPRLRWQRPGRCLASLVERTRAACWVLLPVNFAVQQWFMDQSMDHGIPVIVGGAIYEGIRLPCIDAHHEAICRHAAGKFLSLGHRHVVFLVPKSGLAGDLVSERGFLDGCRRAPYPDVTPRVIHHDGTVSGIRTVLDSLFRSDKRLTGVLVSNSAHALTVVGHLISREMRLPQDVSVISRGYDHFLRDLVPSVACYEADRELYAERLSRLVVELATVRVLPTRTTLVMARFRDGDTLGPAPR